MAKIISLFLFACLLAVGQCDRIGYNRLENNLGSHVRHRDSNAMAMNAYWYQLFRWMLESDNLSVDQKQQWLSKVALSRANIRPNNRLSHYKLLMGLQ